MVPNISTNGRSFRGAGAYHLHDKPCAANLRPRTSDRVAFTAVRNLANNDPRAVLDEMWRTAEDATHLKAHAGLAPTGRKSGAPVKTVSLSWAPGEAPAREEMCRAADEFLKAMGWGEHQALYVAHNDTRHAHIHLIINRVHPDTGRTLNDWQERKRAQKWAHDYERQQGAIRCPARAVRCTPAMTPPKTGLHYRDARLLTGRDADARQRMARETRAAFRPAWAAHYRRQHAVLARFDHRYRSVERAAVGLIRRGDAATAIKTLEAIEHERAALLQSFRKQRAALARSQHARLRRLLAVDTRPSVSHSTESNRGAHRPASNRPVPPPTGHAPGKDGPLPKTLRPNMGPSLAFRRTALDPPRVGLVRPSRSESKHRLAFRAGARELLCSPRATPRQAASRARAEIAVAFAHRWAAIRRMPPEERAAAATALHSEQAAALAARTKHLLGELQQEKQAEGAQRRASFRVLRTPRFKGSRDACAPLRPRPLTRGAALAAKVRA